MGSQQGANHTLEGLHWVPQNVRHSETRYGGTGIIGDASFYKVGAFLMKKVTLPCLAEVRSNNRKRWADVGGRVDQFNVNRPGERKDSTSIALDQTRCTWTSEHREQSSH